MLKLTNTLTAKKEIFQPKNAGRVALYVCGVTPYDYAHVGHGRCYLVFDLLFRTLQLQGYEVTYCRNFTDIDDKLLVKAQQLFGDQNRYKEVADTIIADFHATMHALNCLPPTHEPRVTQYIPTIIDFILRLIERGAAYQAGGNVYFSLKSFPSYGKLSHQKIEELRVDVRAVHEEGKRDPLDFALWKSEPEGQFWQSPWGYGRPGWHIECSAMAAALLGKQIDIHGGGIDLIFPHHENEIAQSEALFEKEFVRCWMHNGLVNIGKEKMAKSLGNAFTLDRLLSLYNPMVIRYYMLSHHYRSPIDFSLEALDVAQKTYQRLCRAFETVSAPEIDPNQLRSSLMAAKENNDPIVQEMLDHLFDDLNSAGMIGAIFEHLDAIIADPKRAIVVRGLIHQVLGLFLVPLAERSVEITPEIQALLQEREDARKRKDFARADAIRDQLRAQGVQINDKKNA